MSQPPIHQPSPRRRSFLGGLRANFLTGLVVIAPIGLTIWLIWKVVGWIDGWVLPFVPMRFQPDVLIRDYFPSFPLNFRGFGVIIFLVFTVLVGWMAKGLIGRSFLHWGERLVDRMPVVRSIYNGLKQITETVFAQSESSFEKACLIEYPRKGIWAICFISTEAKGELVEKTPGDGKLLSVFLPTTPNPTSGFLLYVPEKDVQYLDMSVEDAAKLIISAGLVYPSGKTNGRNGSGSSATP
ncbi:DUF502 domain-containing protein [Frigidibacter sp. ROC022]|uniref:DUF502 domain-containing protein n=1 Tax=Frigidibacter sp. ROC022 TaxID=2971796 RepID=UPI00215AEC23|nr:DUF502 domain-containing protein [Frigidibacter sp. ROC022]MCR8723926.1 DUF502 domain-containing protein [Frigidibacter sp. ROC022]